jgi:hypothetical protein
MRIAVAILDLMSLGAFHTAVGLFATASAMVSLMGPKELSATPETPVLRVVIGGLFAVLTIGAWLQVRRRRSTLLASVRD